MSNFGSAGSSIIWDQRSICRIGEIARLLQVDVKAPRSGAVLCRSGEVCEEVSQVWQDAQTNQVWQDAQTNQVWQDAQTNQVWQDAQRVHNYEPRACSTSGLRPSHRGETPMRST
jgi:hypothetical protein